VPDGGGWAQVYVRNSYDREVLERFGSLFGVLFSADGVMGDKEIEIFRKIEELSNDESNKGNLGAVLGLLKSAGLNGVFAWVVMENEERRVKIGGVGPVAISMIRGKSAYKLLEKGGDQIMSGTLKEGDRLMLGMSSWITSENWLEKGADFDWGNYSMEANKQESALLAGMVMVVGATGVTEIRDQQTAVSRQRSADSGQGNREEELAGNRMVGSKGWIGNLKKVQHSWRDLLKMRESKPQLLSEETLKKKKKVVLVGGIFLVILIISVVFGLIKNQKDQKVTKMKAIFEPLEQKIKEADAIYTLNPVGARDLLRSVKEELESRTNGITEKEILSKKEQYLADWQKTWEKVAGEQKSGLELFFNLGLVRSEFKGNRISFDGKNLMIVDSKLGSVVSLSTDDKKAELIMGKGEDKNYVDVASGKNLVVGVGQISGISVLFPNGQKEAVYDGSVKEVVAGDVFGENLYLLDKGSSEIWKYVLSGSSIGDRRRWLLPGVVFDFTKSLDMAIDSDVWVLNSEGEVAKFRRGNIEKFKLTDKPADFQPLRMAANDGSSYLALLDKSKSRVVLFDKKTGGYVKQLSNNDLVRADDLIYIDPKTLVVLIDGKLYRLPI